MGRVEIDANTGVMTAVREGETPVDQDIASVIARMKEVVGITVPDSLLDEFGALAADITTTNLVIANNQEVQWYRSWFAASPLILAMVVDTFKDDSLKASGTATVTDGTLGVGTYTSVKFVFPASGTGALAYDIEFIQVHIEASASVSMSVSADDGGTFTVVSQFDAYLPLTSTPGKSVVVNITVPVGVTLYSYGILLGEIV